jgi:hypothetical protein
MTSFDDTIWEHLVEHHDADAAVMLKTAPERRVRPRTAGIGPGGLTARRPLAAGAGALIAAITALVLVLSAGSNPPPAYAVTFNPNHGVTIYLREFGAIGKLNARLAALDTRIRAVPVVPGCVAPVHAVIGAYRGIPAHLVPGPARTLEALPPQPGVVFSETIALDTLPGRTLVIPATRSGLQTGFTATGGDGVVIGPAPRCIGES